jgi:hypothetical protein
MKTNRLVRRWTVLLIVMLLVSLGCRAFQGVQIQITVPTEQVQKTAAPIASAEPPVGTENPPNGVPGGETAATPSPGVGLSQHFQLIGQMGGNSYALALDGSTAFLGVGPRLVAVDVSNPSAPKMVGQSPALPGVVRGVALRPPYAYVAAGKGHLRVLDISDLQNIHEAGALEQFQWAMAVLLDGERLYIADNAQGFWIAELTNPVQPGLLGTLQLKQPAVALAVQGNTAYVVNIHGGLVVIDVSDPKQPVLKSELELPQGSAGIALVGNAALIAAGVEGLWVVDISDPARPVKVYAQKAAWADGIAVDGELAYLTDMTTGLVVFDISDPFNPRQVGVTPLTIFSQQVPGQRQLVARDGRVLLANQNQGLVIVDASQSAQPVQVASFDAPLSGSAFDLVLDGSQVFVTRDTIGLGAVNIENTAALGFLGSEASFVKGAPVRTTWKLAVQGAYAFAADMNLGFRVVKTNGLQEVARIEEPQSWSSLALDGTIAYATTVEHDPKNGDPEARRSLRVIDISDPLNPRQVGLLKMANNAQSLAARDGIVYYPDFLETKQDATGDPSALHLVDISNPANPVQISQVETTGGCPHATSVVLKGNYAILGEQKLGLCVIDVSDPTQPRLVANWRDAPMILDMALVGDRLFAAGYSSVVAIDVSDPLSPVLEDMTFTPGLAYGIDAAGDRIFVADMDGGLTILEYH